MTQPYAAGSLYSTVDDLLTWDRALHAGKVIGPASLRAMFTDYGHGYGYGQYVDTRARHVRWSHGGGINGFASMLAHYPNDDVTMVVLSNLQDAEVNKIATDLAALAFGEWAPPTTITLPEAALEAFTGAYLIAPSVVLRITRDGHQLVMQFTRKAKASLFATSERTFVARVVDSALTFDAVVDGHSPGLTYHEGTLEQRAPRIAEERAASIERTVLNQRDALEGLPRP